MKFQWILPLIALFALASTAQAEGDYYQWIDEAGVVSLTDDAKRIPAAYKDQAVLKSWAELATKVESRWTPQSTAHPVYVWTVPSDVPQEKRCVGHITITTTRIQSGAYNREMYVAVDECGRTISVTPQRPRLLITR